MFSPSDFTYDADARTGVCPAGKSRYRQGASHVTNGSVGEHVRGAKREAIEPVFANLRYHKRLDPFTLRGRTKGHGQWLLFCLVHHIEKLSHAGYAAYITRREGRARSRVTPASRESLRITGYQCPIE